MKTERVNLTPSERILALIHYGHRCVYCGARPSDDRLDVDHVIPVSKGGTNDMGNLVVACKTCNIGKAAKLLLDVKDSDIGVYVNSPEDDVKTDTGEPAWPAPVPEAAWAASRDCRDLVAAWLPQFQQWWPKVDVLPGTIYVDSKYGLYEGCYWFKPTFVCRGRVGCDIGEEVRVLVVEWREIGELPEKDREQIRNAVISGYQVPTMILMGPPGFFYGVLVNERRKGMPRGFIVDQFLQPFGRWESNGWYPDEAIADFEDLREPFCLTPHLLAEREWDFEKECFVGVYSSCNSWGL